jgi:hypothetical protein
VDALSNRIADEVTQDILQQLQKSEFFSLHTDETTNITVSEQCGIILRYFDNTEGKVRCAFFKLELVQEANADGLIQAPECNFSLSGGY